MAIAAPASLPQTAVAPPPTKAGGAAPDSDFDFSFHDLVSVINPLQHFPIVSTIYRAVTGDTIKPLERVVGDTLYGGWMGLVSSVANLLFQKETGKDFGDTVLALLEGNKESNSPGTTKATDSEAELPAVAARAPMPPQINSSGNNAGVTALASSITSAHIDPGLGQRALYAYRRSMDMAGAPADLVPAF
jgi:hypothetical protein